jgi:hypothetical protein
MIDDSYLDGHKEDGFTTAARVFLSVSYFVANGGGGAAGRFLSIQHNSAVVPCIRRCNFAIVEAYLYLHQNDLVGSLLELP